jgi:[acyl-carrier-protein] S-malonyltransferase
MSAFLFPGQGSQAPGMGAFLFENFSTAKHTFEEASDAIQFDLKKLCFTGTEQDLALTENTQPALLCVSTATARVLARDIGVKATITAGHSIGEYASLVLAGAISFPDAMKAVRLRGQAMQAAVPVGTGGMTATLGLSAEQVQFLCDWAVKNSGVGPLSPANYNCDGQIVISGNLKTLDWLKSNFKAEILPGEAKRAKLIPLQVSAPFHCEMMRPAQEKMEIFLNGVKFSDAEIGVIQNVNAAIEKKADALRKNLIEQVSAPVRWTQSMHTLKSTGTSNCYEVGHGSVVKGLLKKIDSEFFTVHSTSSLADLKAIETLGT